MKLGISRVLVAAVLLTLLTASAFAQGGSTLTGVVLDAAGGVIPGATVVVTSNANQTKFQVVTDSTGAFTVPALSAGSYGVTVSLSGFKTATVTDVRVQPGVPTSIKVTLEVGGLTETITVTGASAELVNTRTATVASTLNVDQIAQIPTPTRDVLNAVTYLVGVNQTGIARGAATINGLPESFLNITLDGVSNQDTFNKSTDGFFAPVRPRQDAIEAVTVTTAAGAADVGGHGATSINFVTRQGTNRFTGSGYEYFRHTALNSNYWFNIREGLPKNDVRLNQFGARIGGPIVIPGVYDGRGKGFFFFHYEQLHLPNDASRNRDILNPEALNGTFLYDVTAGGAAQTRRTNVLTLGGQYSTPDPTTMRILNNIAAAVRKSGVVNPTSDPLVMEYSWLSPALQTEQQPAIRIDYNLTNSHRLSGTFNKLWQDRNPDQLNDLDHQFPDTPNRGHTIARRPQRTITLRSTLSSTMVSEFKFGISRGERINFGGVASNGPQTFEDQGGYAVDLSANIDLTNWHRSNNPSGRSAYQYTFNEAINWQMGRHSVMIGGEAFLGRAWSDEQQQVTGINLGFDNNNDPDLGLFNQTNFPGASGGQLTDARDLYGLLTGRVIAVTGIATLDAETNKYVLNGLRRRAGSLNNYSLYVQDSWRMTPTVTLNAGLRWDVQTPFSPNNDTMSVATFADVCGISGVTGNQCRFFDPTANSGVIPTFKQYTTGTSGYHTDWNNVAPNIGVAWRPNVQSGWLRSLLGDPEQATIRGGYSVAYERQGFGRFTGVFGPNRGSTISLTRNANSGLVPPGESWPVLISQTSRLYSAPFPESPTYPIALGPNRADSINAFHPDIQIASARSWTVGVQRSVTKDTALEVRYVGTRGVNQWETLAYNERNIIENGFLDEFRLAMANLEANNLAGGNRLGSFAYFGPGTATNPLPIYLAYLNGRVDSSNPAAYTGGTTTWANTGLAGRLVRINPSPTGAAGDLDGNLNRRNAAASVGYSANFFVVNPHANGVSVSDSGGWGDYHALQIELRRRFSQGFAINGSYQYAIESGSTFLGLHYGRESTPEDNVRHAIKAQWTWTIPVGRGRRYGTDMNAIMNGILGGWEFNGGTRIQARMVNFGNVRLVGMTKDELQKMYKFDLRVNPANNLMTPYMLPEDVIQNTRRAFSTSSLTLSGYAETGLGIPTGKYIAPANSADCFQIKAGDCAPRALLIRAPFFTRVDIGVTKRFPLSGRTNFELRVDVLNLFDNINFTPEANPGTNASIFEVDEAYRDPDNNFDPGGRLGQISFRINW